MTKRKGSAEPMHFQNIDLEIGSKRSLAPLIAELGAKRNVSVMYVGRLGGLARAHYEVNLNVDNADKIAMALVRLVNGISAPAMKAWRNAKVRDFNIGIQSSDTPSSFGVPLAPLSALSMRASSSPSTRPSTHLPSPKSEVMDVPVRCIAIEVMSARRPASRSTRSTDHRGEHGLHDRTSRTPRDAAAGAVAESSDIPRARLKVVQRTCLARSLGFHDAQRS